MKTLLSRQTALPALSALMLALAVSRVYAAMTIQPVLTDMPPSEKPYQMIFVGNDKKVQPELRNSIYVASFGSSSGSEGEKRLNSDDPDLPLAQRFAIEGYPRFIQIKDNGNVIRWDVKDYPTYKDSGENKHGTQIAFTKFLKDYNTPEAKPLSVLNYLQPLHSIDYRNGKLLGQQTFTGKYVLWDMEIPVTAKDGKGILGKDSVQINKGTTFGNWREVRVRLSRLSNDGKTVYGVVRSEAEDPDDKEFSVDLTYFDTDTLRNGKTLNRRSIKNASSGHGLFITENNIYTGGKDIRKTDMKSGRVTIYKINGEIDFGEAPPSFLNMIVDEKNNRIYTINSRDIDPDETDAKTYDDYLAKFKEFSAANKHGLYVFDISPDDTLTLKNYIPMVQPVELVLSGDGKTLFANDRMMRTVSALNIDSNMQVKDTVTTTCHNSNLAKDGSNNVYVTSVYTYQLRLVGAGDKNCNSISKISLKY
ncbi:YncE family protein [Yokenella regensburgei]|uniref:YncE family protein n=1 Tax=Yokenella regensburgei TaxID=158877 RepID=UPI003ED9E884